MNATITFLQQLFPEKCLERVFLVGGSVRDLLLGHKCRDIDLVAALSADEFVTLGFRLVEGKSTAPIWFRHDTELGKIEVTPLHDLTSLDSDLARRDFTINALAMTMSGKISDPLGGRRDLEQRQLRVCSPSAFFDDPLRIFRAFRFEADGWRMTPETATLIQGHEWSGPLATIPIERFSREMLKAFASPEPELFFQRMLEFSVGKGFLPEIFRMPHIPAGPLEHHPEGDLFTHSIQVLERVAKRSDDPLARFCALFHDIGKLATPPELYPKHHGHDQAGFAAAKGFSDRLRLPAEYRTALAWTSRLHGTLNLWGELRISTKVRVAEQAVKAGITDILTLVSSADKPDATAPEGWEMAIRVAGMTTGSLGIDPARLEAMPIRKRADFISQRRAEMLWGLLTS